MRPEEWPAGYLPSAGGPFFARTRHNFERQIDGDSIMIIAAALAAAIPAQVEAWFQQNLFDPETAQIKPVETTVQGLSIGWRIQCGLFQPNCKNEQFPAKIYCYRVRAKNIYGAYVGWRIFWLASRDGVVFDGDDYRYRVKRYCGIDPGPAQN